MPRHAEIKKKAQSTSRCGGQKYSVSGIKLADWNFFQEFCDKDESINQAVGRVLKKLVGREKLVRDLLKDAQVRSATKEYDQYLSVLDRADYLTRQHDWVSGSSLYLTAHDAAAENELAADDNRCFGGLGFNLLEAALRIELEAFAESNPHERSSLLRDAEDAVSLALQCLDRVDANLAWRGFNRDYNKVAAHALHIRIVAEQHLADQLKLRKQDEKTFRRDDAQAALVAAWEDVTFQAVFSEFVSSRRVPEVYDSANKAFRLLREIIRSAFASEFARTDPDLVVLRVKCWDYEFDEVIGLRYHHHDFATIYERLRKVLTKSRGVRKSL